MYGLVGAVGTCGSRRGGSAPRERGRDGASAFDRPCVLHVLARMVADLDALARCSLASAEALPDGQKERRAASSAAAELEPPPRRLSRWEERAAARQALGLPPYERS